MTRRTGILAIFTVVIMGMVLVHSTGQAADMQRGELAYAVGNYQTAHREWRPLAESGDTNAQYKLGRLYAQGLGVPRDTVKAMRWYTRAAEQDQVDAQFELGNLMLRDFFGAPDISAARRWYGLAKAQGHTGATARLNRLDENKKSAVAPGGVGDYDADDGAYTFLESKGRCAPASDRGFTVEVILDLPPAPIDHSRSIADLNNGGPHGPSQVVGLAVPDMEIGTSGQYGYLDMGDHKCFWVEHVEARVVYRSMKIFIASEYKKGSCAYGQILRHEKEHVSIARINLNRYKARLRSALSSLSIPKPGQPVRIGKSVDPRTKMRGLFRKLVAPVFKDMMANLKAAQGKIDTPESYTRLHRRCKKW